MPKYGILSSSINPEELSLTVTSAGKVVIGLIGTYAAYKGLDSTAITSQLQLIVAEVVTVIPLGYATWQALKVAEGAFQKVLVYFGKKNAATAQGNPTPTLVV